MIVPDASAVALMFADPETEPRRTSAIEILRGDPAWMVPEHWRTEVLSVMRGLTLGGKLDAADAERAVDWVARLVVMTAPTGPHIARMWELRSNLSTYDAGYVAVAESHDLTLVTADVRIARSGVARCPVQTIA
ncbi:MULTISPECIES: type II toxin-antitoxin system VapC family toxin [Brevibacterium]|jgi:predicted nucleic acid-binding protein|uniref:type II toxin-antitoxin system VapC family toxin n=1 Tax=Brevibacterium TaxID=1696 RepID=UPI001BA6A385|nr:type II toxin-antitoxin system VapC family toxin [Brevibacterium sp. W7.2]